MNRKNRQRAPRIKPSVRKLIVLEAIENINKPRLALAEELKGKIERIGEIPPSEETLIKWISDARNTEPNPLDKPWHIGKTPDLPSGAIAAIFEVRNWLEKSKDSPFVRSVPEWTEMMTNGAMSSPLFLTIREAQWITRLYKVKYNLSEPECLHFHIHNKKAPIPDRMMLVENPYKLWETAKTYADYQRLCEIARIDFDTSRLDEALLKDIGTGRTKYDLFFEYKSKKDGEA